MENYYSNSQRWVFDSDGNYLHSKGDNYNPNIHNWETPSSIMVGVFLCREVLRTISN